MSAALSVAGLLDATGGRLVGGHEGRPISGVAIDTRRLPSGGAFFALRGRHTDGHAFLADAARRGAAALVVSQPQAARRLDAGPAVIAVGDVARALHDLAVWHRARLGARVVAITGTCGKSTTKELLAAICRAAAGDTTASPASYNNHLGVPLSVLGAPAPTRYLVLELGTNRPGEITPLSRLARPDVAVITNIGPGHLAGLGSLEGVARAKAEITAGLKSDGPVVLSTGDPHSRGLALRLRADGHRVTTFGPGGDLALVARQLEGPQMTLVTGDGARWTMARLAPSVSGSVLAAIAAARQLELTDATIARGLAGYRPLPMRHHVRQLAGGVTLIDDAYNANPLSVAAALESLAEIGAHRRKMAVLGEMLELGDDVVYWHRHVGGLAADAAELVCAVGPHGAETARAAACGGALAVVSADAETMAEGIADMVRDGDAVLVKGSRGMAMEQVVRALAAARPEVEEPPCSTTC